LQREDELSDYDVELVNSTDGDFVPASNNDVLEDAVPSQTTQTDADSVTSYSPGKSQQRHFDRPVVDARKQVKRKKSKKKRTQEVVTLTKGKTVHPNALGKSTLRKRKRSEEWIVTGGETEHADEEYWNSSHTGRSTFDQEVANLSATRKRKATKK